LYVPVKRTDKSFGRKEKNQEEERTDHIAVDFAKLR